QGALMSGTALIAVPKVDTAGLPRYATSGSVLLTPKGRVRDGDFASLLGGEAQQVRQIEQAGEFAAEGERDDVVAVYHNAGDLRQVDAVAIVGEGRGDDAVEHTGQPRVLEVVDDDVTAEADEQQPVIGDPGAVDIARHMELQQRARHAGWEIEAAIPRRLGALVRRDREIAA